MAEHNIVVLAGDHCGPEVCFPLQRCEHSSGSGHGKLSTNRSLLRVSR